MQSNWIDKKVSLYENHRDNKGREASYRDIMLTQFAKDLPAIAGLRKLNILAPDYKIQSKPFKAGLQCFTPAALMVSKEKGNSTVTSLTGIMQLDFDYGDIKNYDLVELKQAVFKLPFIAFCGLSCSGFGFYALALIAEPERLNEYAEHCFEIFKTSYGISPDESKGKKPENLRYLSYDANMLIRYNPEPLRIKHFKTKQAIKKNPAYTYKHSQNGSSNSILNTELSKLQNVQSGNRWATVQKVAYTIGGLNNVDYLNQINHAIISNPTFIGEEQKYLKCAYSCFMAGSKAPLIIIN